MPVGVISRNVHLFNTLHFIEPLVGMTTTPEQTIDLSCLRNIAVLGKGKTGSVALYADDTKTDGRGVVPLHAVKRVRRQFCTVSPSAARRVLQEKNALQALKRVSESASTNHSVYYNHSLV